MASPSLPDDLLDAFREALVQCRRLYLEAAQLIVNNHPELVPRRRETFVSVMDDLHKGLLVKLYVTICEADRRWTAGERRLAQELFLHNWGRWLEDAPLREKAAHVFGQAAELRWYSLLRPFARMRPLQRFVAPLEKIFHRVARLTAMADGQPDQRSAQRLEYLRQQFDLHLRSITLDDDTPADAVPIRPTRSDTSTGPKSGAGLGSGSGSGTRSTGRSPTPASVPDASRPTAGRARSDTPSSGARDEDILHDIERDIARMDANGAGGHGSDDADPRPDDLPRILAELDDLIGMTRIKSDIRSLTNFLQLQREREAAGLPRAPLSLHTVFTGNPGTGKTTVARIVGRILGAMGILEHGHLVETDRSGLVAEYSGQTGPRTNRKIDEAIGGVLFIDEAYSLVGESGQDSYGAEAVQTLLKRMEDDRDRLVVILAGYPQPMQRLLTSNPGLSSRFHRVIEFPDYEPVELARIFASICERNHYELPAATRARLLCGFDWLFRHRDRHFGNGRLARNLFEEAIRALADRVVAVTPLTRELLTRIEPVDVRLEGVPSDWLERAEATAAFDVSCPTCAHALRVGPTSLGASTKCPSCGAEFIVPWSPPVF